MRNGIEINLDHFKARAIDSGDWPNGIALTRKELMSLLKERIDQISFDRVREDIIKFIPDARVLDIWSPKYFHDLVKHIRYQTV